MLDAYFDFGNGRKAVELLAQRGHLVQLVLLLEHLPAVLATRRHDRRPAVGAVRVVVIIH